jgi:serine/threonine-protein kinase RsbW
MNSNSFNNSQPNENYSTMRDNMDEMPESGGIGIGIKLIAQIADELSYTHDSDHRNCLKIVKYFQPVLPFNPDTNQTGYFKRARDVLNIFNWLKEQRINQPDRISNQPLQKITLQLNSDIATVTQVLYWVEQLENLPIPEGVLQLCKLAVVEGFTNAVHHAHQNLALNTPIDLAIAVFNERLEIQIWDWGKPFDFKAKLQEQLEAKNPFGLNELGFML